MKWRNPSPADSRIQLVRPLLDVSRAGLQEFAEANRIRFREDTSNASLDFQRNRIRHELLPLLRARYQPALDKTVSRTMRIIADEAGFVSAAAERWLKQERRSSFDDLPVAVQRRCLQVQLLRLSQPTDFELIEKLRATPNTLVSVSPGTFVMREKSGLVRIRKRPVTTTFSGDRFELSLQDGSGEVLLDGVRCRWQLKRIARRKLPPRAQGLECFDAERIGSHIVLRHWQAGDRYQPIGMKNSVKLQDWFTNQKIPRARRHELLVAETAFGEIFWVEGLRISERFKLSDDTKLALFWRWRRG